MTENVDFFETTTALEELYGSIMISELSFTKHAWNARVSNHTDLLIDTQAVLNAIGNNPPALRALLRVWSAGCVGLHNVDLQLSDMFRSSAEAIGYMIEHAHNLPEHPRLGTYIIDSDWEPKIEEALANFAQAKPQAKKLYFVGHYEMDDVELHYNMVDFTLSGNPIPGHKFSPMEFDDISKICVDDISSYVFQNLAYNLIG